MFKCQFGFKASNFLYYCTYDKKKKCYKETLCNIWFANEKIILFSAILDLRTCCNKKGNVNIILWNLIFPFLWSSTSKQVFSHVETTFWSLKFQSNSKWKKRTESCWIKISNDEFADKCNPFNFDGKKHASAFSENAIISINRNQKLNYI